MSGPLGVRALAFSGGGGGGGGGFAFAPTDWRAHASTVGVGTSTALAVATYPDLSAADAGVALASYSLGSSGALLLSPTSGTVRTTPAGIKIADVAAGDYTVAVWVAYRHDGVDANVATYAEFGLAGFTGTDTSASSWAGIVVGRSNDQLNTATVARWQDSGVVGRQIAFASPLNDYSMPRSASMALCVTRVGNIVTGYVGDGETWTRGWAFDEGSAPAGVVALMCSCESAAPASLVVGVSNILTLEDGAAGAGSLPGLS